MLVSHTPVAICYNSPVFVPNGDSIGLHERLIDNDREAWGRTYTCSNINNDAATMELEPKVYRKKDIDCSLILSLVEGARLLLRTQNWTFGSRPVREQA